MFVPATQDNELFGVKMMQFILPEFVADLVVARNKLRDYYRNTRLSFTFDGKLIGDIGEALAVDLFGIELAHTGKVGIDGYAPDKRTVQVKATGTGRGPIFRQVDTRADHLLFFDLDFDSLQGSVIFNGPEEIALQTMPDSWSGQRMVSRKQIEATNRKVEEKDRLQRVAR
tara:strand:- start:1865 stop:2377 length:513 start_codon:yes stop_codon:yes gene_type:complete